MPRVRGLCPSRRRIALVVYCEGICATKPGELAEALRTDGFPYVSVMPDGFEGWQAAGGPTEGGL